MKEIRVNVSPKGKVTVQTDGFQGEGCVEATQALEEALGLETENRELTPEYYEAVDGEKELA